MLKERNFILEKNIEFKHLFNSKDSINIWFPQTGFPTTYLLDKNNTFKYVINKGPKDIKDIDEFYNNLVNYVDLACK